MREAGRLILTAIFVIGATATAAGQGLSGPLATPGDAAVAPPSARHGDGAPRPASARRSKSAATVKRHTLPATAKLPGETAAPPAVVPARKTASPSDPLSFGLKWNGSNDSAGQTRIENLNGNAAGTGAEVGMKLHF